MREVEDSGIDIEEESIIKSTIEGGPLTVKIKLPKSHRTYTEKKLALKSNLKKELRRTEKFFQIVSLPEKKDVVSPISFFSRSSDPVLPENKVENNTNDFHKLNATVPLTLAKSFNIINKKHRKVTLNEEATKQLEKYSKKLNKFLVKKGLRKISKPEKKRKKCLESVSKVKRVKKSPVNYRELYNCLISKRSLDHNPRLFSERLESMIDLRYDFDYEKRSYYKNRKIVMEQIKKAKYPPIKIKITLPSPQKIADKVDPVGKPIRIPRIVARSSASFSETSTKRRSTSPVSKKSQLPTCSLPRIPRKPKDDSLKKDQDNAQGSSSTSAQSCSYNDSSPLARPSTEIETDLISREEQEARKRRERDEADERRRQAQERAQIEQRNREMEAQRIIENRRQAREAAEKKRMEKELMEQALKKQEEDARKLREEEEMLRLRNDIEKKKADADERERMREKLKLFKEQSIEDFAQIQKDKMANRVPGGEPPMKMIKVVRTPQPDSTSRDVFGENEAATTPMHKQIDNSGSPTFAKPIINKDFHFDRKKPPKVKKHFPTRAEKEKSFERFYSFENCNFDTVREEVKKYRTERQKKKDELEFDESGPPKSLSIRTIQYSAMKMVNGILGLDDDYHAKDSKMLLDGDEWDYTQISYSSLQKTYDWPFEKTKGIYWPIVIDCKKTKDFDREEHIRRLLKNHSYSGRNLTSFFLTEEPSEQKARDGFLEAYISSGTDELDVHEWARYNSKGGRFANRKPFKTISTDQTREDGVRKHNDGYGREMEYENRYLESYGRTDEDNRFEARRELISHYVNASRIDVYSLRDRHYRSVGSRKELVHKQWANDGYNFQSRTRDRYLGLEMERLTDYYDGFLRDIRNNEQFDKWCFTPMLVSLYYQLSTSCSESLLSREELAELKARRVRYNEMCNSRYPTQTKLSSIKHMCKLTEVEKRFWTILYDNLICNFKDLPTLSQLMDRPEYIESLNTAYQAVKKRNEET